MTIKIDGILGILTIVFIILKLTGSISWPWLWVLSPVLIPILVTLIIIAVAMTIGTIAEYRK